MIGDLEKAQYILVNQTIEVVHDLSANNEVLKERIKTLESAMQDFNQAVSYYSGNNKELANLACNTLGKFKQLLAK